MVPNTSQYLRLGFAYDHPKKWLLTDGYQMIQLCIIRERSFFWRFEMRSWISFLIGVVACSLAIPSALCIAQDQSRNRLMGRYVESFTLPDAKTGQDWQLDQAAKDTDLVVLYFNSTECPVTNRYLPKLNRMHRKLAEQDRGMVVAVNCHMHDSINEVKTHIEEYEIDFSVLKDMDGSLARQLNVTRTAEVILLDRERKVRYRGVVDDRFERGVTRPRVTQDYLQDAVDLLLAGREVKTSITDVVACPLELSPIGESNASKESEKVTFTEHVAPILRNKCQSCHRPKGIGPFELMNYEDAEVWVDSIREVVTSDLMPPWHAEAPYGHFENDRSLTQEEYRTVLDWIDDGALEGDKSVLPKPQMSFRDWAIGRPDLIIEMDKEIVVPADTPPLGVPYKYVWAGKRFEKETWVRGAEVHPGATDVVHHVIAYIVPEGLEIKLEDDERPSDVGDDWDSPITDCAHLVSFVPGDNAFLLDDGLAKRIPAGARIIFEMHYTPTGRKRVDRTKLGLIFADKAPKHEVVSGGAINYWFSIPPGAASHPVTARTEKFRRDSVLLSMNPHMHYRGRSFKYELVEPDGKRTLLLNVPRYNFDWQTSYWLAKPVIIPKGSYILCSATFDNSEDNPFNPDPTVRVEWGEQSWQEMMLAGLEYYEK